MKTTSNNLVMNNVLACALILSIFFIILYGLITVFIGISNLSSISGLQFLTFTYTIIGACSAFTFLLLYLIKVFINSNKGKQVAILLFLSAVMVLNLLVIFNY